MSELLSIKLIKQDSRLQPRAKMDTAIIDEYTESMKRGDSFPAVVVFKVGEEYFLVDGYHRYLAIQGAKFEKILADVRPGTMRDAILFSAGVNATHGIRRTNEDKRRSVLILLRDKEWKDWADTKIAATCNVSVDLVATVRKSSLGETDSHRLKIRKIERAGKIVKMDTSKIGKSQKTEPVKEPEPPAPVQIDGMGREIKTPVSPVQPSLAAQMAGTIPPEPPVHRPPPCLGGGGCDQTPSKFITDKVRGNCCDAIGVPLNQLPGNECPYDVKLAQKSEFVPASELKAQQMTREDPESRPLQYESKSGMPVSIQGIPKASSDPGRTLSITFDAKQWEILKNLQRGGFADGFPEAVKFCVDEIGNRGSE